MYPVILIRSSYNASFKTADGGSEVMLSSPAAGDHSQKKKKDKKKRKRRRHHSSVSFFPGCKLTRHADRWSAVLGQEGEGPRACSPSASRGKAQDSTLERNLVGLSAGLNRESRPLYP